MPELKARLQSDLNQAMKSRDELRTATLRMTLAAITREEVAGAQARELSDDEVQRVITRETRKRRRHSTRPGGPSWPTESGPKARCSRTISPGSSTMRNWPSSCELPSSRQA